MDVLPEFELIRPSTVDEVLKARKEYPGSRLVGGGTDLLVNIRRGIGDDPPALIDMNAVEELKTIKADKKKLEIGASVHIADVAADDDVQSNFPVVAAAAGQIAGPTHRRMGTVGGNICLDTRCIYYNQSQWWREANNFCLKYQGDMCHVAPGSDHCFATYSGDLAPALMVHDGEVDLAGPDGKRSLLIKDMFTDDGQYYMRLEKDEFVVAVRAKGLDGYVSAYDKVRVRHSIDYPLAGVAVALKRDGKNIADLRIAITGTNPRPVLLEGLDELSGKPLDEDGLSHIDDLVRDQIMAMKTTFTPGMYRRRVANVLARRLTQNLYDEAG